MGIRFSRLAAFVMLVLLAACGAGGNNEPAKTQMVQPRLKQVGTKASDYATVVQQLYIAYFGRPADPSGLANFEAQLLLLGAPTDVADLANAYKTNAAIAKLIDSFGLSTESQTLYASAGTVQFVASIFTNVLGRQPLAQGSDFWVAAINSGATSKGNAALSIMAGAFGNSSAQADVTLINNRVNVAANFTSEVSSLNATASYAGAAAAQSARQMLAQVNSSVTISLQQMVTVIEGLISSGLQAYAGSYCGTVSGTYSGTVDLTLTSNGGSTFSVTGTVYADGQSIPIQGQTIPPALGVELMCTTGECGYVTGTITTSGITGSYSIINGAQGNISLSHSCQ